MTRVPAGRVLVARGLRNPDIGIDGPAPIESKNGASGSEERRIIPPARPCRAIPSGKASNSAGSTASHSVDCSPIVRETMNSIPVQPKGRGHSPAHTGTRDQHADSFAVQFG